LAERPVFDGFEQRLLAPGFHSRPHQISHATLMIPSSIAALAMEITVLLRQADPLAKSFQSRIAAKQ
jgi:hypothetical protein